MINKVMIRNLTSIGSNSTYISKMFNLARNLVAHCVKNHILTDALGAPKDDNSVL